MSRDPGRGRSQQAKPKERQREEQRDRVRDGDTGRVKVHNMGCMKTDHEGLFIIL